MFFVEIDKLKNVLRLTFELNFDEEDAKQCLKEVEICLPQLKSGLKILTDLSNIKTIASSAVPHIEHIMDICNKKGVSKVARVIPDPNKDVGFNIMSLFHYSNNVHIITCPTMTEALKGLFVKQA